MFIEQGSLKIYFHSSMKHRLNRLDFFCINKREKQHWQQNWVQAFLAWWSLSSSQDRVKDIKSINFPTGMCWWKKKEERKDNKLCEINDDVS